MPNCKESKLFAIFSDTRGSVAIIVSVMLLLLVGILMMTVDLGRVQNGKSNNQSAIDATVLGAAEYVTRYRVKQNDNTLQPSDVVDYGKKILLQNLTADQNDATISSTTDENGNKIENFQLVINGTITGLNGEVLTAGEDEILVYACLDVKTNFSSILNNGNSQKVCSSAKASLPGLSNVEIVFALDASYSMNSEYTPPGGGAAVTKISALQASMNTLIDKYADKPTLYFGIVPFTGMVDLGNFAPYMVADDLNAVAGQPSANYAAFGQPQNNLSPGVEYHKSPGIYTVHPPEDLPITMHFAYSAYEDNVMDNFARIFNETHCHPGAIDYSDDGYNPCTDYALSSLRRVPLTSREGNDHPENGAGIVFDDAPPVPGQMFQAYWHNPYDFFLEYDNHQVSWDGQLQSTPCGTCYDIGGGGYERQTDGPTCLTPYDYPCQYDIGDPGRPTDGSCDKIVSEGGGN